MQLRISDNNQTLCRTSRVSPRGRAVSHPIPVPMNSTIPPDTQSVYFCGAFLWTIKSSTDACRYYFSFLVQSVRWYAKKTSLYIQDSFSPSNPPDWLFRVIIIINDTLARSLEPVVTECYYNSRLYNSTCSTRTSLFYYIYNSSSTCVLVYLRKSCSKDLCCILI